jgi:hypothetical protein
MQRSSLRISTDYSATAPSERSTDRTSSGLATYLTAHHSPSQRDTRSPKSCLGFGDKQIHTQALRKEFGNKLSLNAVAGFVEQRREGT